MTAPVLLPGYRFTSTEANLMWAHVEAAIDLAITQDDARVDVAVTVQSHGDPFGDHAEWEWTEVVRVVGAVEAGPTAGTVRVVPDDRALVAALTFDAAVAVQDRWWETGDAPDAPALDFWSPLFRWGWRRRHAAKVERPDEAELTRRIAGEPALMRVEDRAQDWGRRWLDARLRFWDDTATFSVDRSVGYQLRSESHLRKQRVDAAWALIFHACDRVEPAPAAAGEGWYRVHAAERSEYVVGWVPAEREADADAWIAFVDGELRARRR